MLKVNSLSSAHFPVIQLPPHPERKKETDSSRAREEKFFTIACYARCGFPVNDGDYREIILDIRDIR
jgi:hypothetical protein